MTRQILVSFDGERSGAGELTWGQLDIWAAMQRQQSSLSVGGAFPFPPGTTVADVASDLRFLMCRHDSLRTRLRFAADGRPQQVLSRSGEIALEVIDPGDADPAQLAAALYSRYEEKVFDYVSEWPIRWAVIARESVATHLVTVISHLAIDGMGAMALLADLGRRDPVTGRAHGPVTAPQPLELARRQAFPAARRQNSAALRYWERTLRSIPARRFTGSACGPGPRYWQATYDSAASYLAIKVLAARNRTSTSTVLLAAFAVVLTRITDSNPAVIQVVVDNRFRRDLAEVVSPLCTSIPCVIDVADATFDEVIARAWGSAINAYKLAYYNPVERAELEARIGAERGEEIDVSCFINDRRMSSRQEPGGEPLPAPGDLRAALPHSTLSWGWRRDRPCDTCFLSINNVPGTLSCELYADTRYVSPADMEACLRGLESVVVGAALH
jgi:hypothetical protein